VWVHVWELRTLTPQPAPTAYIIAPTAYQSLLRASLQAATGRPPTAYITAPTAYQSLLRASLRAASRSATTCRRVLILVCCGSTRFRKHLRGRSVVYMMCVAVNHLSTTSKTLESLLQKAIAWQGMCMFVMRHGQRLLHIQLGSCRILPMCKWRLCVGLARAVNIHRTWSYIWWSPCQNYRKYTKYIRLWPNLATSQKGEDGAYRRIYTTQPKNPAHHYS